jgi:nitrogen permease regulator 3-like protein
MSTPALPPNPSLVAIILVARTRKGVKRIFHYPPNPGKEKPHIKSYHDESSADESSSTTGDDYSSVEDDPLEDVNGHHARNGTSELDESGSASPEKPHGGHPWRDAEERKKNFLGLPYGFERLLCPTAAFHKKRFEMTISGLTFLGWPVFARENGEWKRKRKSRGPREHARRMSTISEQQLANIQRPEPTQADESIGETTGIESTEDEHEPPIEDDTSKYPGGLVPMQEDDETEDATDKAQKDLSMFHVVFVMNPPPLEYQLRLDEMYKHVVKKFSRAMKWEQARSHYVQRECDKLKSLKAKHGWLTSTPKQKPC